MLIFKTGVSKKEKRTVENILDSVNDLYGDFYSTQDNIRILLRDNIDVLFNYLKKGSKIAYELDNEKGLALILKEKGFRTYIKILTRDEKLATNLLKIVNWNISEDLYVKLHKNNPLIKVFQRNGYTFIGNRGSEVLLSRKYIPRPKKFYRDLKGDQND